jgi:uncharacterized membrane protein (DUF4010 family)
VIAMNIDDLFSRFAVALGIGLLIGLERGWRTRDQEHGKRTAGIRTFALTGLLGAAIASLARMLTDTSSIAAGIILGSGFIAYSLVFAAFTREENRAEGTFSVTTTIAGMLTFALAAYALIGDSRIAAGAAVATTALLAARENLHKWVKNINWAELRAALVLLTMTFIALPLLPDTPIGPFGGVNLREIWLIAIVLAGISFLAYAALKQFGPSRGILIASLIGGMVSSTAVTVTNARHAAAHPRSSRLLAGGIAAATAVCFLRVLAISITLNPPLLAPLLLPLAGSALTAAIFAMTLVYGRSDRSTTERTLNIRSPFSFWPTIGFAVALGVIIVLARVINENFGATGVTLGAIVVGLVEVDSITISLVRLIPVSLSETQGAIAILAAVASDTLSKIIIGGIFGGFRFAVRIASMAGVSVAVGAALFWFASAY